MYRSWPTAIYKSHHLSTIHRGLGIGCCIRGAEQSTADHETGTCNPGDLTILQFSRAVESLKFSQKCKYGDWTNSFECCRYIYIYKMKKNSTCWFRLQFWNCLYMRLWNMAGFWFYFSGVQIVWRSHGLVGRCNSLCLWYSPEKIIVFSVAMLDSHRVNNLDL